MKRQRVIEEIISSERSFLQSIDSLVNFVVIPLLHTQFVDLNAKAMPEQLTPSTRPKERRISNRLSRLSKFAGFNKPTELSLTATEHTLAFSNIREIYKLSQTIHARLNQPGISCGAVILAHKDQLSLVYETYVGNYETNLITMAKLDRRPGFSEFVQQKLKGVQLGNFCIAPVQRVPRYLMLLNELLKQTEREDPTSNELPVLKEAITSISHVCQFINQAKGHLEQVEIILDIEKKCDLDGELVKPRRRLLFDGVLMKVCRRKNKPFHFWLFNDMLMYGQKTYASGYDISHQLELDYFQVKEIEFMSNTVTRETDPALEFKSTKKSFIVVCKDEIEKMMWLNYFNQSNASIIYRATQGRHRNYSVRRNSNETSGSMSLRSKSHTKPLQAHQEHQSRHIAPLWVQDAVSKNCQKCEVVFTLFRRRHHCRLCGALVCNECSSNREYIPTENKRVRVCDSCMLRLRAYGGVVATPNDGTTVVMNPFNMMDGIVEEKEEEDGEGEGDRKGEGSGTDDDDDDDVDIEEVGADAQEVAQVVAQVFEQDGGERKLETFPTKEDLRSAHVDATARKMQPSKKKAGRGKKKGRKTGTEQLVMSNQKYAAFMTRRRRQENT